MSRIRSTHPEQWTDEDFVSCSPLARLLALSLRNEADDRGVFEWKPVALKMRCLPADTCDVPALLEELVRTRQVQKFTVDGKHYGVIRNFTRFQRPKSPKYRHPEPPGFLQNAEMASDDDEPFPPDDEINPQMKEEGGNRNGRREGRAPKPPFAIDDDFRDWAKRNAPLVESVDTELESYRDWQRNNTKAKDEAAGFRNWLRKANGFAAERAAKDMMARARAGDRTATAEILPHSTSPDDSWRNTMRFFKRTGKWIRNADGPPPGEPGCRVPQHILDEFKNAA